jgi:hypothetical protein
MIHGDAGARVSFSSGAAAGKAGSQLRPRNRHDDAREPTATPVASLWIYRVAPVRESRGNGSWPDDRPKYNRRQPPLLSSTWHAFWLPESCEPLSNIPHARLHLFQQAAYFVGIVGLFHRGEDQRSNSDHRFQHQNSSIYTLPSIFEISVHDIQACGRFLKA